MPATARIRGSNAANFSAVVACPNFIPAAGADAAWSLTPSPNPFVTGQSYIVLAQGADIAGNVQSAYNTVNFSSLTFTSSCSL